MPILVCVRACVCARVFCISGLSYKTGVISVDVFARMFRDPVFSSYIIPVVRLLGKKKSGMLCSFVRLLF